MLACILILLALIVFLQCNYDARHNKSRSYYIEIYNNYILSHIPHANARINSDFKPGYKSYGQITHTEGRYVNRYHRNQMHRITIRQSFYEQPFNRLMLLPRRADIRTCIQGYTTTKYYFLLYGDKIMYHPLRVELLLTLLYDEVQTEKQGTSCVKEV